MSVAQTKAARRRMKAMFGKPVIGRPHYKRQSVAKQERREFQRRAKLQAMQGRKKK